MLKFYRFHQNNSGGFHIGHHLIFVQAKTAAQANKLAQKLGGVYFDWGASDCECCGKRWRKVDKTDGYDKLLDKYDNYEDYIIIFETGKILEVKWDEYPLEQDWRS